VSLATLLWLPAPVSPADGTGTPPPFHVCTDFHCDRTVATSLTAAQWRQVRALFHTPAPTPAQERAAIRRAIALLEELTGQSTGNWRDRGRNYLLDGRQGQLDCIAESRNTTTFLHLLERAGLLRRHRVEQRALRRRWLVSDHWSAVIREYPGEARFAVDSWFRDNGEPPCIQPLDEWRTGHTPAACKGADTAS
jgi:hypothetical protein